MRFLNKELTEARACELVTELGVLGVVDLLYLIAEKMDGAMSLKGQRVSIVIKARPKPKKLPKKPVTTPAV